VGGNEASEEIIMPGKRRRTLTRSPALRLEMWDKKMRGDVYETILESVKPLALQKVGSYQAIHEHLIDIVKDAVSRSYSQSDQEKSMIHEYMWFGSKLWRLSQTYDGQALQNEADALFMWYVTRGRDPYILRTIAQALNIKISPTDEIVQRILARPYVSVIAEGSATMDGTDKVLAEYEGPISFITGYIDLSPMENGDTITISAYVKIRRDGEYKLNFSETFENKQPEPAVYILPRLTGYAVKIMMKQTTGTYKTFEYMIVKVI
jgi:hypothetical protein